VLGRDRNLSLRDWYFFIACPECRCHYFIMKTNKKVIGEKF
jgi:hypothetical protein